MILSQSYMQLLIGRLLTGLGVGCGFVVAPVYITEITPPHIRGKLVALTDIMINMGILLGGWSRLWLVVWPNQSQGVLPNASFYWEIR